MDYYAGIGSRETPNEFLGLFYSVARYLSKQDIILRSGGADGADISFEKGCDSVKGGKEIYLPWKGFNGSQSNLIPKGHKEFELAWKYHPAWDKLSQGAKKLQARNCFQILGYDLGTPSKFVICWTKGGKDVGGTAQALRIAKDYNIPIFNCGIYDDVKECQYQLKLFLKEIL